MRRLPLSLTALPLLIIAGFALAEGPHVHGVAQLDIAVEGSTVMIEFTAPAADIVGFEHAPETGEQRDQIAAAAETLEDGATLFALTPGAACQFAPGEVSSALLEGGHDDDHHDEHKHGDDHGHKHDDDHGHKHDDDHSDKHDDHAGHDHGDEKAEEHSEFRVSYAVTCDDPAALTGVDVKVFTAFPSAEKIQVRTITDAGQSAVDLTADASRLTF